MTNPLHHLAIIPDGSGRWAMKQNMPRFMGHEAGYKTFRKTYRYAVELGIPYVTYFTLSLDNLKRKDEEVFNLFRILTEHFPEEIKYFDDHDVIFNPIGDISLIPDKKLCQTLKEVQAKTKSHKGTQLNIAIAYSGTDDILQSIQHAYLLHTSPIEKDDLKKYIFELSYLGHSPPVDFCIRTGNEYRISNFCLWHLAYAEFYFSEVLWPDFSINELQQAIEFYQTRKRRFGREYEQP